MKKTCVLFLLLFISFNLFSKDIVYFGKNCKRVTRSNMLTRPTNRVYFNGLLVSEDKKVIERPIRDCWVHESNSMRYKKDQYYFEYDYKGGSGKFNGNYIQFYDEAGVEIDFVGKGGTLHGIFAIALENQNSKSSVYMQVPGSFEIELKPEMSCMYYFSQDGYDPFDKNAKKKTFKVRSEGYYGYIYQKLYYNNNVGGEFLRKEYESIDFEPFQGRYIDVSMFHKYYPNYPDMN